MRYEYCEAIYQQGIQTFQIRYLHFRPHLDLSINPFYWLLFQLNIQNLPNMAMTKCSSLTISSPAYKRPLPLYHFDFLHFFAPRNLRYVLRKFLEYFLFNSFICFFLGLFNKGNNDNNFFRLHGIPIFSS